jgi:hypothetical protein
VSPNAACENSNGSAMVTPAEIKTGTTAWGWIKNAVTYVVRLAKRVATLEERVTALESALETQPPDACPFCGERAMRLTEQSMVKGDPGKQWMEEYWTCEKCTKEYCKAKKL